MRLFCSLILIAAAARAQTTIQIDAAKPAGPFKPIYAWFGYDEPNYTYAPNGKKLITELVRLSSGPVYFRTHFLLATGDGTPGLKWGSTNAYTEDAAGKPVYDWTITDRIIDTYLQAGGKPFIEIGFMPQALSTKPDPYHPTWIPGAKNEQYSIGWSYPPKDFAKWGELVHQWVKHAVDKYGRAEVATWYWEVWNEPDISYWHGTPEEYNQLYDYAAAGVKKALPEARVGGPATTGPANERAANYLKQFLEHCAKGNVPLDFITYHAKGRPTVQDGHVRMGIAKNAEDVSRGMEIVRSFPKFRNLPIILTESDPEGCAACSARVYPQNAYRNGPLYASYTAMMMKSIFELADRTGANIAGMLTWAFEFEDQPYFDGFRTLATNGVDKPVLNLFRMAGLMRGDRLRVESSSRVPLDSIIKQGVRAAPSIDAMAVRNNRTLSILAWNYHDDDVPGPVAPVQVQVSGLGANRRVLLHHYRIDDTHSNAWTTWKHLGLPQKPTAEQYAELESAGQLQLLEAPRWIDIKAGAAKLEITLPRQAVSLLQFTEL